MSQANDPTSIDLSLRDRWYERVDRYTPETGPNSGYVVDDGTYVTNAAKTNQIYVANTEKTTQDPDKFLVNSVDKKATRVLNMPLGRIDGKNGTPSIAITPNTRRVSSPRPTRPHETARAL